MKITLEPTPDIVRVHSAQGNTEARVWVGHDENGVPVRAWINTVSPQSHEPAVNERFATELREVRVSPRSQAFDMRYFTDDQA